MAVSVMDEKATLSSQKDSSKAQRTAARLAAVQAFYQMELTGTDMDTVVREYIQHRIGHEVDEVRYVAADADLFASLVRGTSERQSDIHSMIVTALGDVDRFQRMELLLKAILQVGVGELLNNPETPAPIIINDYMEVCHAFFHEKEPALVNGVLDRVAKALRN